jgi:hypothetical protein
VAPPTARGEFRWIEDIGSAPEQFQGGAFEMHRVEWPVGLGAPLTAMTGRGEDEFARLFPAARAVEALELTAIVVGPTCAEHLDPVREALSVQLPAQAHTDLRGLFA